MDDKIDWAKEIGPGREEPPQLVDGRLLHEMAESIGNVFWISSPDRRQYFYLSPAFAHIWGRSCQSLVENPEFWINVVHPEDRERIRLALNKLCTGEMYEEEYRIVRPDLQIRWIREKVFPVRNSVGVIVRVAGVACDITEGRHITEQLRHSQKMDAIGQLAGGIAHDFNNFLSAMILQITLSLKIDDTPEEVRDGLKLIQTAAEHASGLIRQLLLFSRKQTMQVTRVDLNQLVQNFTSMLQRIIGEDIQLHQNLHNTPLPIRADTGMLDQILMNLAINSRDAMPQGGKLIVQTTEQELGEDFGRLVPDFKPGRYACLSVTDTGTGIPPDVFPRIFEPFFTTKEPGKGTGLGLSTVFGIVKQHGGYIHVESQPGCGSAFRIYLPVCEQTPESTVSQKQSPSLRGNETILFVEDDPSVRKTVRVMLERNGFRILEAADGVQALKLWEQHRDSVRVLLTDLVMPAGVSGLELAQQLQRDKPQLKVVFVSGYPTEIAGRQYEFMSSESFLPKPFLSDELLAVIRRCLDNEPPR